MGMLGKLKGLVVKNKKQVSQGIEKASDVVEKKVGSKHAATVDKVADKVQDAVEKLD